MSHTILRIDASARDAASVSRQLTDRITAKLGGDVIHRDLAETPPSFVTEEMIGAYFTPPADRSAAQDATLDASNAVVAELQKADTIVIGMPIYNFGVPAALKAWADLAARVGVTFQYSADGPKGLLDGKRAIIAVASGGTESGSEIDWATPWLKFFLGFLGITDVQVITADQLNMEAESKIEAAYDEIEALAA
ncbi:FMN-dependent NADH-azoreductase [Aestuariibius sp. 2305UL40-4]|uniref:FMN-dependent NADH-azoreductase n=1 Tax=Aestuariibius violaceus TaxID=3234132 RepID=UPI00345E5617